MKIYDISMEISEGMLVYPGSPHPMIRQSAHIPKNVTNESLIRIGSHTGTHADAGRHVSNSGYTADKIPLGSLLGRCRVVDLTKHGSEIRESDIKGELGRERIILLKTNNSAKQYKRFRKDFAHVTMDAARYLIRNRIKTIGIDYLSVKKFNQDDDVHALLINNMTVFEGLCLKGVPAGVYTFAGLPLKIGIDAALARAVLVKGVIR